MYTSRTLATALLVTGLLIPPAALAIPTISLTPSAVWFNAPPPRNLTVDVVVSDLGVVLGAFDFTLSYDPLVLAFHPPLTSIGHSLGNPNPLAGETLIQGRTTPAGTFNLVEVSLVTEEELMMLQSDGQGRGLSSFALATIGFIVRGPPSNGIGVSPIRFSEALLSDAKGNAISPLRVRNTAIRVTEPPFLALLAFAVILLANFRRAAPVSAA
jgi:hypothetical protein